jgi:tetratricopeptide (TPR) repeat protein
MAHSRLLYACGRAQYYALLTALASLLLLTCALAPSLSAEQTSLDHAARVRKTIDSSAQLQLTPAQVGNLWAQLASDYHDLAQFDKAEEAYTHALNLFEPIPSVRQAYAVTLENLGSLYMITDRLDAALNCQKHALDIMLQLGDPLLIAQGQGHVADVYLAMGNGKQAVRFSTPAVEAARKLPARLESGLDWMLITHSYSLCLNSHCGEGLAAIQEALPLVLADFGAESFPTGQAYVALGYAELRTGAIAGAEEHLREGVRILRVQLPPAHPFLLNALSMYHDALAKNHHDAEAHQIAEEQRAVMEHHRSCSGCTVSVNGLRVR